MGLITKSVLDERSAGISMIFIYLFQIWTNQK
jgi:hypothetical protein